MLVLKMILYESDDEKAMAKQLSASIPDGISNKNPSVIITMKTFYDADNDLMLRVLADAAVKPKKAHPTKKPGRTLTTGLGSSV